MKLHLIPMTILVIAVDLYAMSDIFSKISEPDDFTVFIGVCGLAGLVFCNIWYGRYVYNAIKK